MNRTLQHQPLPCLKHQLQSKPPQSLYLRRHQSLRLPSLALDTEAVARHRTAMEMSRTPQRQPLP